MSVKEKLNSYSLRVFEYLEINHTDLLDKLKIHHCDFGKNYLEINIPKVNINATHGLYFSSEDERLTLGFDNYHCHLHNFYEQKFETEIIRSMNLFTRVLNNELFVLRAGGTSLFIEKSEIDTLKTGDYKYGKGYNLKNLQVISWTGKYDLEIEYTHVEQPKSIIQKIKNFIFK